ncbi:hypothetical protein Tco_1000688 [Tanacetum coccineum]
MIQPELEGSTQGYPLVSVEVLRYDTKGEKSENMGIVLTKIELVLEQTQQGSSFEVSNIQVILLTMKMEILLEPTSNKLMVGDLVRSSESNLKLERTMWQSIKVKEFQRSFHHSDTERLSRSNEVLKLKNFKKDATLKLFKSTNQEKYEHVGPEVTRSQDDKVTRWQNEIMLG